MQSTIVFPLLILLTAVTGEGSKTTTGRYPELSRLHAAMQIQSFPSQADGKICLWLQETPTRGRLRVVDVDEWPVNATAKFFNAHAQRNDLENVVIISENGLSVRFVDPNKENVVASRGDVVAILLSDDAK